MKDIELLLPYVLPYAKGCPEPTAIHHLRSAAVYFCEESRAWRESDQFELSEGQEGLVVVPHGATLHEIEAARLNGQDLDPVSLSWLNDSVPLWREQTGSAAKYITQLQFDTVMVVPAAAGTLALDLLLKPSEDADQLPDFLIDKYARVIAAGALGEILLLPNQPFTNGDLATVFANRFSTEVSKRSSIGAKGQQRAPLRTKAHFL